MKIILCFRNRESKPGNVTFTLNEHFYYQLKYLKCRIPSKIFLLEIEELLANLSFSTFSLGIAAPHVFNEKDII
jgi:hypothetical protein